MIKIMLVERNLILSEYLKTTFDKEKQLELICICTDGRQVLEFLEEHSVDVVVIDFLQINGLVVTHEISCKYPNTKVIGFSTYENGDYNKRMIELGADKCLSKYETTISQLLDELKKVPIISVE